MSRDINVLVTVIGFREYVKYVKEIPNRLLLKSINTFQKLNKILKYFT
jgi:hypothetical protein